MVPWCHIKPLHQMLHCHLQREAGCSQDITPEGQEAEGCIAAGGGREKTSRAIQRSGMSLHHKGLSQGHRDFQLLLKIFRFLLFLRKQDSVLYLKEGSVLGQL